jgi:putative ABC transport system permease protein
MFRNLIKIAFRVIRKDFSYSLINILGLTIGITSSIFILLYIIDELSFDRYHEKKDRIYRVVSHITEPDDEFTWVVAQVPFAPQVKADYPEVIDAVRFIGMGRTLFKHNEIEFYEEDIFFGDSAVFNVFTYNLFRGDPSTALSEPNTIVVTETFASRYFGDEDPMGQSVEIEDGDSYKITGVMKDVPRNSHLRFDALVSKNTLPADFGQSWGNFGVSTYILLQDDADYLAFQEKIQEYYERYMSGFKQIGITIEYVLQPLTDIHLKPIGSGETEQTGDITYLYIFGVVGIFMLIIASINYMNLSTARSSRRAREVGLRKVVGSNRGLLIGQFLTESTMLALVSFLLSLLLVFIFLSNFNTLAGKDIPFNFLANPFVLLSFAGIIIFVGIFGGSYPAFFISRYNPIIIMKGVIGSGYSRFSLRKVLVVLQFAISLFMIISTWGVYDQLKYMKNKDVGFDKENIIRMILNTRDMRRQATVLKQSLQTIPNVLGVGGTNAPVGEGSGKNLLLVETPEGMQERGINMSVCDHDFIETLGITILEGRDFSEDIPADTLFGVLINETLAKRMNWDNPIGKKFQFMGDSVNVMRVVGLMKDYHQTGLYNEIESYLLLYRTNNFMVYVKLDDENITETIRLIEGKWNEMFPDQPFEYTWLKDDFDDQFEADERRGTIFTLFSVLTVIIACLGLFGLASYTVDQRTREVGVRKVMGADEKTIITLFSREFLILIGISILLAIPASYYFMYDWLQNFIFRTDISALIFIISGIITLLIALATISLHTLRAGRINPADAIRYE